MKNYLDDLSKKGYQPGGGSAGALAFCLGASLVIKSIQHTLKKDTPAGEKNRLKKRLANFLALKNKVYPWIDKDGEYFSGALKSKGAKRRQKLKEAERLTRGLAQAARRAFSLTKEIESDIRKSIKSDFSLGVEFIKISELSASFNLEANKIIFTGKGNG